MVASRIKRKKTKKKKLFVLMPFLFLILAAVGYSAYEYNQGFNSASQNNEPFLHDQEEFNGENGADNLPLEKMNILILGIDSNGTEQARTDTIMVAQYNPEDGSLKLASIMRDSYVSIPGYANNKINASFFFGGPELIRQTIKENFNIDIQYYALINFDGFTEVVDTIAPHGIEIDVEKRMYYVDNAAGLKIDLYPGIQKLNGEELLKYARFRHDAESDFGRVRRQQQVTERVKEELISAATIAKIPRLLGTIQPYIDTNIETGTILSLAKDFIINPADQLNTLRLPIDGTFYNAHYSHAGAVLEFDKEENQKALNEFFSDEFEEENEEKTNELAAQ
ncbi:LCP family protein [Bacillus taeanensis]|uniref:Regulatory protein MsrR n=1 Tax=Bacillus taeanensis TaxID=273032 RepID=A0A366Y407_9BACI|nr:LCP family protein [Bacillus taeanensis]RBW70921.1 LytR family transcriptional regulator [Bacillus taeanensis]